MTHCWWCTYNFESIPCFLPIKMIEDVYYVYGCFCSYNCAAAYSLDMDDYNLWSRHSLIKKLCHQMYGKYVNIEPAPPRECLEKFGGTISIQKFRLTSIKCDNEFRIVMPPMKPIISAIEQNNNEKNPFNKINKISNQDNLVLKRSKTVGSGWMFASSPGVALFLKWN